VLVFKSGTAVSKDIPFRPDERITAALLADTLKEPVDKGIWMDKIAGTAFHSQPVDSLLKITMHRSDNFFAEQTLLMVGYQKLGVLNDSKAIENILATDLAELPQKPKWVDGSGLSRYDLVSPRDFVYVLGKMKAEFSWERISTILAAGNSGTLAGYYKDHAAQIHAKTGTLSNNLSLSGYITTRSGKQLIFSIMVNNHQASATAVRRTIEKFLTEVMDQY